MGEYRVLKDTMTILGLKGSPKTNLDLMPVIRKGIPSSTVERVSHHMNVGTFVILRSVKLPQRTIARRIHVGEKLSPDESERIVRVARVLAEATAVFESEEKARTWLRRPSRALGGHVPLEMLDTGIGSNAVLEELGRIEHGVFA